MNFFGIITGIATLVIIGLGFPLVILSERRFGYWCWPYMVIIGILLIGISLLLKADWLSVITGILGATFIWGSTELKEQAVRAELGWFQFNANKTQLPYAEKFKKWKAPDL